MPSSDQGVNLKRYMLVPRTLIFVVRGEQVLLLKGAKSKRLWAGLYNGIGGHVEPGEDIYTSAKRELREETGLTSTKLTLCGIITVDTGTNPGVCIYVFTGECLERELTKSGEGRLEWVKNSDINNIPHVSDLPVLIPKIFEFKNNPIVFFAYSQYNRNGDLIVKFV